MIHDVFISYSSHDKAIADAICSKLENNNIRCWIAPRDILPGVEYGEAIIDALVGCQVLILVFSSNANNSSQVRREVERAVSKGKIIVPFRIEDILPTKAMEFALGNTHWLDAMTPPLDLHITKLTNTIHRLLNNLELQPSLKPNHKVGPTEANQDVTVRDFSWIMKATAGPGLRSGFGMVYDDKKEAIILHGGIGRGKEDDRPIASILSLSPDLMDTWIWDGSSWLLLKNKPLRLTNHALAYNRSTDQNVIYGGWNGSQRMDKTYILSGEDWVQTVSNNESGPGPRESHAMVCEENRKKIILFGGLTINFPGGQKALDDTWEWNGSVWTKLHIKGPEPRWGHKIVYDESRGVIILFGGYDGSKYFNDTWIFEGKTATWSKTNDIHTPLARCSHGMTYNNYRKKVLLFGGVTLSDVPLNDLWEWDGNDWNLIQDPAPPKPRYNHGFVYDIKRNKTLLFGGFDGKDFFQDTWEFSY
jgi:hypothetical protein